jgi:hypothetical protein
MFFRAESGNSGTFCIAFMRRVRVEVLEHTENVKVFVLEKDALSLQVSIDDSLLLANGLRLPVNFLQQDLHKVDLTERELTHLLVELDLLLACVRRLQTLHELLRRDVRRRQFGAARQNPLDLLGVEGE